MTTITIETDEVLTNLSSEEYTKLKTFVDKLTDEECTELEEILNIIVRGVCSAIENQIELKLKK
jgi:hypothetical protein